MNPAERVLEHALSREPTGGIFRLICIDGPSGAGKTTLAKLIVEIGDAHLVHTDDLCPGWDGIPELPAVLHALMAPLALGRPGRHPRYDWHLNRPAADLVVPVVGLIVLEGVGAGASTLDDLRTTLVWVDADPEIRRHRGVTRDGADYATRWDSWAEAESAYFSAEQVRSRADLLIAT